MEGGVAATAAAASAAVAMGQQGVAGSKMEEILKNKSLYFKETLLLVKLWQSSYQYLEVLGPAL